jgi:transposase
MSLCPGPYPRKVRDDVVRVARDRDPGVTVEQIAKDFGVHPMTLFKWLRQADIDNGAKPGMTGSESADLRQVRKRIKLLEQENEVLRRAAAYLSQAHLPRKGSTRS